MAFTIIEVFNGISCLIFVSISMIIGAKLIIKYFEYKKRQLILVGFTWIGLSNIWWSAAISFLVAIGNDTGLTPEAYFFLGNFLIPIALIAWVAAFTDMVYKNYQKIILTIISIMSIIFYIIFFYFLFNNPSMIGERQGLIDANYGLFQMSYVLIVLVIAGLTGVLFAQQSLRSKDPEIKLKGKFLLLAMISFFIGALLDGLFTIDVTTLIIYKIILISSAIEFYLGFFLPEKIKKMFLKEK